MSNSPTALGPTDSEAPAAQADGDAQAVDALNALIWEVRNTDLHRAFSLSEEAVRLATASGRPDLLARSRCLYGICANGLSRHDIADAALEESLALSSLLGDRDTEARCRHFLGRSSYLRSDYAQAIEQVTASLRIREEIGDLESVGASLNLLGNIFKRLCDFEQALLYHAQGLAIREQTKEGYEVAESLINVGCVYLDMGDYAQALVFHQRSLDQARRLSHPRAEALSLANLSADFIGLRRYDEALEIGSLALNLGSALGILEIQTGALTNMGDAHANCRRWDAALGCYKDVLQIARRTGDRDLAAEILCLIGPVLAAQGELGHAREHLAEAYALALSVGARKIAFSAAKSLSDVCRRQGDYAAALGHYETFRRLEKEVFTEEADDRAKSLVIKMEVEHHQREAEALAKINTALQLSNIALQEANARLEALATTDPLTSLPNHRALVAALDSALAHSQRSREPCALLFLDIDHFKCINDTHGHPVGDAVLRGFAACARACLRGEDTLGRWGGEEFLALLPGTDLAEALQIGERVRAAVAACTEFGGTTLPLTCSVGAAASPPEAAVRDALVETADRALYSAKHLGRNQVRGMGDPAFCALDGSPPHTRGFSALNRV